MAGNKSSVLIFIMRTMQKEDLHSFSNAQLIDLLAKSTKELLALMNKKDEDGVLLKDKRNQVQWLQEAIHQRKFTELNKK